MSTLACDSSDRWAADDFSYPATTSSMFSFSHLAHGQLAHFEALIHILLILHSLVTASALALLRPMSDEGELRVWTTALQLAMAYLC